MIDQIYIEILMTLYFIGIGVLGFYFLVRELVWLEREANRRRNERDKR